MISFKQHRKKVLANTDNQKVFITLTIIPEKNPEIQYKNNTIDIVFAVDTSASMRDAIEGTSYRKIDFVKETIKRLLQENVFFEADRVGLVSYDTESQVLFDLTAVKGYAFKHAIDQLKVGGTTFMNEGMENAIQLLSGFWTKNSKRIFLLTDGVTNYEKKCLRLAQKADEKNITIVSFGVGDTYNEKLMMEISETTGSNARHIVNIEDLFGYMQDEIKKARHEMDESVNIKLEAVNGFKVVKVYKIYPNILDFQVQDGNLLMKNLKYDEENIFVFEVLVPNKKAGKTKFFESSFNQFLGNEKTDISKEELFLEYTNDEFDAAVVDNKVLFYLQQYNVQKSIQKIEHLISNREIEKASNLIENTIKIAKRTNNSFILNTLEKLRVEIERNNINENTTKTLTVETKTKTVKLEDKNIKMSEKEIRQKSGT